MIEIVVFGIFVQTFDRGGGGYLPTIIMGLTAWEFIRAVQYGISVGIMWDVWSRSFSSLFVTPLTLSELIAGQAFGGIFKGSVVFIILSALSFTLFGYTTLGLGSMLVVYGALTAWFAISTGIVISALILRFGTDVQSLSWTLIFLLQPISAVIYPVAALPASIQWVDYLSPLTYVMETARSQAATGAINWQYLGYSAILNAGYFLVVIAILKIAQSWARRTGAFARMEM